MQFQSVSASDLQAFLGAPKQLLQQPRELQLAVTSFADTPRSLLGVLIDSTVEQVAKAACLHVNWAGEITDDCQRTISKILQSPHMRQNDRLAVESLKLPLVSIFFNKWIPAQRLI